MSEEPQNIDVRKVQTGTLIYNLIRYSIEEFGLKSMLAQADMEKQKQKMLVDLPGISRARESLSSVEAARYTMANEINIRFQSTDAMRIATAGIEMTNDEQSPIRDH